jgi:hypothetical protein
MDYTRPPGRLRGLAEVLNIRLQGSCVRPRRNLWGGRDVPVSGQGGLFLFHRVRIGPERADSGRPALAQIDSVRATGRPRTAKVREAEIRNRGGPRQNRYWWPVAFFGRPARTAALLDPV